MQPSFLDTRPRFDGATFVESLDQARLSSQMSIVRSALGDGGWHTLAELSKTTGCPEASISARIRDLRKLKFGAHDVQRRRISGGLFAYRLVVV